jgi:hypothetical protein
MGGHHACNETPPSLILTPSLVPFSRPPGDADVRNGAPRSVPLMELLISLDQGSLVDELQAEREVRARLERDWSEIGSRSERDRNEIGTRLESLSTSRATLQASPKTIPIASPRSRPPDRAPHHP